MALTALLKGLKSSKRKALAQTDGARFGTVNGFLRRMAGAVGVDEMAAHLQVKPDELRRTIKSSGGKFTYFDTETCAPAAQWRPGDGGAVKMTGEPLTKEPNYKLSEGSVLDFDAIITSSRRDRDGDVLDPKGAIVDPKMPLLWQHIPFQPIGRMLQLLGQDESKVTGRFMVANTPLGNDAAVLIEAGCLRISHGFAPIEYNPLKDDAGKDMGGWRISKYAMMEASAVSIPSNVDAEIEAFSRGKLHHPLVKSWCGVLNANRKKFVKGGYDPAAGGDIDAKHVHVTIHLKGLPGASAVPPVGANGKKDDSPDDDLEDDEDDEGTDADGDGDADGKADGDAEDAGASTDGGKVRALGEIIDAVKDLAKDATLPKEAQRRLATVAGMFEDVEEGIGSSADAIGAAAKNRDLAGMFTAMADLTTNCVGYIGRAAEELERVAGVPDLPDGAAKSIGEVVQDAKTISDAVNALTGAASDVDDTTDFDGDDDADDHADEEGTYDQDAEAEGDEDDEDDEDGMKDEDTDDDDEKDGDADTDGDDDVEEKDDDADDEKGGDDSDDADDDNPEAVPAGKPNPGVPGKGRRRLSILLGKKALGKALTIGERNEVRALSAKYEQV